MMVPPATWIAAVLALATPARADDSPDNKPARSSVWPLIVRGDEAKKGAEAWTRRLMASHPDLAVEEKKSPADSDNGFLQLLTYAENDLPALKDSLPAEIRTSGRRWRPGEYEAWSTAHNASLARLQQIALMPQTSCLGVPLQRTLSGDDLATLRLLLASRFANGISQPGGQNAQGAIRGILGLAHLIGDIERLTPSAALQAISLRTLAVDSISGPLLENPRSMKPIELQGWRDLLKRTPWQEERNSMIRRFWQESASGTLPALLMPKGSMPMPPAMWDSPDASGQAIADLSSAMIHQTHAAGLKAFMEGAPLPAWNPPSALPEAARDWVEAEHRSAPLAAGRILAVLQVRTALAEASLTVALGETPAMDPATGQPYLIDLKKRQISLPASLQGGVRTLRIPHAARP